MNQQFFSTSATLDHHCMLYSKLLANCIGWNVWDTIRHVVDNFGGSAGLGLLPRPNALGNKPIAGLFVQFTHLIDKTRFDEYWDFGIVTNVPSCLIITDELFCKFYKEYGLNVQTWAPSLLHRVVDDGGGRLVTITACDEVNSVVETKLAIQFDSESELLLFILKWK